LFSRKLSGLLAAGIVASGTAAAGAAFTPEPIENPDPGIPMSAGNGSTRSTAATTAATSSTAAPATTGSMAAARC
jgi:hypothetical protein